MDSTTTHNQTISTSPVSTGHLPPFAIAVLSNPG